MRRNLGIPILLISLLLATAMVGCSRSQRQGSEQFPMTICHATGSETNEFVSITVNSVSALSGHQKHEGDIIPAPEKGCPEGNVVQQATAVPTDTPTTQYQAQRRAALLRLRLSSFRGRRCR